MDSKALNDLALSELNVNSALALTDKILAINPNSDIPETATLAELKLFLEEASGGIMAANGTVTLVELNAGKTLISNESDDPIAILSVAIKCNGAFGALTSAEIGATTDVISFAQAQMTNGANLTTGITGATITNLGVALEDGEDIVISKTGSAATTATGLEYAITYMYA